MSRINANVRWSAVPDWVSDASKGGLSHAAVRLFAILGRYANSEGGGAFPSRQTLATKMGLSSTRSVDAAKQELIDAGALVVLSGKEKGTTNDYTLVLTQPDPGQSDAQGWAENCSGGGQENAHKRELSNREPTNEKEESPAEDLVSAAWTRLAPPLIPHREAVLRAEKTRRAIRGALKVYPVDEVVAAVENYAKVLGSDEYVWSYRWTLAEFLARGLDKFVPDADPLGNMPRKRPGPKAADFAEFGDGGY